MEPEFRSGFLHDYTTLGGKIRIFMNRLSWKWILPGAFFVVLVMWAIAFDKNQLLKENPTGNVRTVAAPSASASASASASQQPVSIIINPSSSVTIPAVASRSKSKEEIKGPRPRPRQNSAPDQDIFTEFNPVTGQYKVSGVPGQATPFNSILSTLNKSEVIEIYLSNVEIDAPSFSADLQGSTNIKKICMDHVSVTGGNYSRVYLPNLTDFNYHQNRIGSTLNYSTREEFRSKEKLKSLLFFDVEESGTWDVVQLLNLKVNVRVSVGGATLVDVNRSEGLVNLNVEHCQEYLAVAEGPFKTLDLSWCNTSLAAPFISDQVTFLKLNNAVPSTSAVAQIIQAAPHLQEFHGFLPYLCENASYILFFPWFTELQVELNVARFPPSIRNLTISKLQITARPDSDALSVSPNFVSPIELLNIEQSNVSGIVENFHLIFPKLKRFSLMNLTHSDDAYGLLENALKIESLDWILFEEFKRRPTNPAEEAVEALLKQLNIPEMANNFIIEIKKDGDGGGLKTLSGYAISEYEKDNYRYSLFGFNLVEDYQDYLLWDAHWRPHW